MARPPASPSAARAGLSNANICVVLSSNSPSTNWSTDSSLQAAIHRSSLQTHYRLVAARFWNKQHVATIAAGLLTPGSQVRALPGPSERPPNRHVGQPGKTPKWVVEAFVLIEQLRVVPLYKRPFSLTLTGRVVYLY